MSCCKTEDKAGRSAYYMQSALLWQFRVDEGLIMIKIYASFSCLLFNERFITDAKVKVTSKVESKMIN